MLITNGTIITWDETNQILENQAIFMQDGVIKDLGPQETILNRYPEETRLDAHGQYVMPGNICAHTHFYGAFARGMNISGNAPGDFPEILQKLWWPLDKSLAEEEIRYSALVCLLDAIRHGTTTLVDHHASPNHIAGSLDEIATAVEVSGLRAVLCYEVTDRDGVEKTQAGIDENLRFIERCRSGQVAGGRVAATFGLHASLTLSDATLDACRQAAPTGVGFHIHAAESIADQYDCLNKSGLRVVDRLSQHGILGPNTIVAHAVHVDAREIELLAESGTWVTHQPRSNMNNAVGVAQVESMLRLGVKVGLGNDGFSNAMWEEWKAAYLIHKVWALDPRRMPASLVAQMAIYHNARLASSFFPDAPIGVIRLGAAADLILVDYQAPTPVTTDNLPWHIVFGFHESMITTTIVAGKLLMQDRQILTLDEEKISARSRELASATWSRYQKFAEQAAH
jgi:putative selenium metabolism protein SsnA